MLLSALLILGCGFWGFRGRGGRLAGACHDDPVTDVFDKEGEEDSGHDDGRGGSFVFEFAHTVIGEHEIGVGVKLNN